MKKLKTFLIYFGFVFSALFLYLNKSFIFEGLAIHGIIYSIFIVLTYKLLAKIILELSRKQGKTKYIPLLVTIVFGIIYISPIGNKSYISSNDSGLKCESKIFFDERYIDDFMYNNSGLDKPWAKERFSQAAYQEFCWHLDFIMTIPFLINPQEYKKYLEGYIYTSVIRNEEFKINRSIVNKYLLNDILLSKFIPNRLSHINGYLK